MLVHYRKIKTKTKTKINTKHQTHTDRCQLSNYENKFLRRPILSTRQKAILIIMDL